MIFYSFLLFGNVRKTLCFQEILHVVVRHASDHNAPVDPDPVRGALL